jgi:outer membrane autotransporter protein
MMRRTTVIAAAALLGVAPMAQEAAAGQGAYITGNLGTAFTKDATNQGSLVPGVGINIESEYDAGIFVSGAVGYRWAQGLAVEGEVLYSNADVDKLTITSVGGTSVSAAGAVSDGDISTLGLMVNGAYNHNTGTPWTPFLMAGVGVAKFSVNDVKVSGVLLADDSDAVFAYQVGAGVDYEVNQQFSVGLGYRFFGTEDPTLKDSTGTKFDSELSQHIFTVRGTVNF